MQKRQESISDEFKRKIGRFTKSGAYLNYCEEVYGYREYLFNMMDREQIDFLLQNIPVSTDDVILDLGCGSGSILNLLCKKYGCRGVGIDTLDPEMFRGNPNLVNYLCGDIDRLQEYGLEQTITLSVDSLYFSGDLEKLLLSFVTKRNSRLYFFYSQYLLGEGTVSRDSLKEDRTKVGEILNRYATSYRTIDFSMNEKCLYIAAQDVFGKSYQDMKPLIEAGSESLLKYAAEAHAAGLILSDEAVTALGGFDDQMQRVNARLETAGRLAALVFLPSVSGIVGGVTDILSTITAALSDGFQEADITTISDAISGQLKKAVDAVGENAPAFAGVLSNVITSVVNTLVELLPQVLPTLAAAAIRIVTGILTTIQQNAAALSQAVVQIVAMLAGFLVENLPLLVQTGLQIVTALAEGIAQSLPELIPAIVGMVLQIVNVLTEPDTVIELYKAGLQIILAVAQGLILALPELITRIPGIVLNIAVGFVEAAPQLWESGQELIRQMYEGIVARFSEVFLSIGPLVSENIVQPVKDKVSEFFSVGQNLIVGIWNGISDKIAWLKSQVRGLVNIIKGWFTGKDGFDEHSPSKWGIQTGYYLTQGMGIGLSDGLNEALSAASNVITKVKNTMDGTSVNVNAGGSASPSNSANAAPQYVFHIYARDKETAVEAADATLAAFARGRWAVST